MINYPNWLGRIVSPPTAATFDENNKYKVKTTMAMNITVTILACRS